ncbi:MULTISPECIES: hypothetical protein [Rhodococcus]|uniref:hypothetical protein n=1 Tax=Rhodococcus TaxID=1827 RepID=UPI0015CD5FCC|nr:MULTISPECIES: hypothetical protein [Rhodococcus]QSE81009.1 hypothetical protein JWS14_18585 [Rhodococcus koreensis]
MSNPNEFETPATDRTDMTPQAAAPTCCSTERQTTCCDRSEKSTCCGPAATAGGGCGCQ